jgi:transcriptional regulator with XRE-family HTH domain
MFPFGNTGIATMEQNNLQHRAVETARAFGAAVRKRRAASGMTQDELALATGVGRRFLIDLEAGKASCQLGRSLLVAEALGLRLSDLIRQAPAQDHPNDDLPSPLSAPTP